MQLQTISKAAAAAGISTSTRERAVECGWGARVDQLTRNPVNETRLELVPGYDCHISTAHGTTINPTLASTEAPQCLWQSDFDLGTKIISEPGAYKLCARTSTLHPASPTSSQALTRKLPTPLIRKKSEETSTTTTSLEWATLPCSS